ncbi:hypothetical protein [Enterovibrio paralichthyis]|uniref:hypothetical protein n=1 Tax=Enterovibrio paralichthyis TaxID=2853805 RepID=UPI001C45C15A|nr:hypothetical protein [Enterovibrio paralichthyis]MBV7299749.1 hypothetical protein [Enterovibrio paralichthyis]
MTSPRNKNLLMKTFILISILIVVLFFYLVNSAFSSSPIISRSYVQPGEVKQAVSLYKKISNDISQSNENVEIFLSEDDLNAIFKTSSHVTPRLSFDYNMVKDVGLNVFASLDLSDYRSESYINVSCVISGDAPHKIDVCQMGDITVPGQMVYWLGYAALTVLFDDDVKSTYLQFLDELTFIDGGVYTSATTTDGFKETSKTRLKNFYNTFKSFIPSDMEQMNAEVIRRYLTAITNQVGLSNDRKVDLVEVFNVVFQLASDRSQNGNPIDENSYALWSVSIAFANPRFSELIGFEPQDFEQAIDLSRQKILTLESRHDLALHFLYSAIIERVGSEAISNNIGELKELYDANEGGSGFDFSDLAADISGARFSSYISSSESHAYQAQRFLSTANSSGLFNLRVDNKTVLSKKENFTGNFMNEENERYIDEINGIKTKVARLPLYMK